MVSRDTPDLARWLPDPIVRSVHRREAAAPPAALWSAAGSVALSECRVLGRLVRWRIPGLPSDLTYHQLFRAQPFVLLEETACSSVSGLCGQIWTLRRDYPCLDGPAAFEDWQTPGTVRVLFAHWAEPVGRDRAALVSEVHIEAIDSAAGRGLRLVRPLIAAFEGLIDREPLAIAARRAEAST
ncbi:MAG: hypothetical protein QOJ55_1794 [Solirubrobacteraceae bacterium]|jgi:hypothetical protein|nr:hypothetical protein [Solirubrobacteraceae bacterium]MDX6675719.1 hypothetical protein [Solirubrobacteraceae bacterium]